MFWRKHIKTKLLLGVTLPVVFVMVLTTIFVMNRVESAVTSVTKETLSAQSEAAANQVSGFFEKYRARVEQITETPSFNRMLQEINQSGTAKQAEAYQETIELFDKILKSDQNIALVWSADFDSGESIRSGGIVKGLPGYDIKTREWYTLVQQKRQPLIMTAIDSTTGELVTTVLSPIFDGSNLIGCSALDITVAQVSEIMSEYRLGQTGFFVLVDESGDVVYHPDKSVIGKNITQAPMSDDIISAIQNKTSGFYIYNNSQVESHGYLQPVGDTGWQVLTGLPTNEFYASYRSIHNIIFIIFGLGLILIIVAIAFIATGIVKPIRRLSDAAGRLAAGDLDVKVEINSIDETSLVANSLSETVARLKKYILYIDEISGVLNEIASGKISFELKQDYSGEFAKVREALENISRTLTSTLLEIRRTADQVAEGSEQVSAGAQALSEGATEQAASVEELAATINEISGYVKATARNAVGANEQVEKAGEAVMICSEQMREMVAAIAEISAKSKEIDNIIKTIEDISFQTNILALNAAVEAASAGIAGRGFAVIADEVRNLANKSSDASKNTSILIEDTIKSVENGTRIANETAESLMRVVDVTKSVNESVERITEATNEQADSITQVTLGVDQISSVVQTNSATAEESAAASEELSSQAQILKNLVNKFTINTDTTDY